MDLHEVRAAVLRKIKPSKEEEADIALWIERLSSISKKLGYEGMIVGSIGKHTWIKGDHDIDWFVLFPKSTSREDLEKKGLELGKNISSELKAKFIVKYAEHPYTQISADDYKIDVVPCYKLEIGEKIKSAVDRSPLHVQYVLQNMQPTQRDEVRLLKQFMKGSEVYGSDVKTQGFSGYLCEILIMKYGSFQSVLQAAKDWKAGQIIDIEEYGTGKNFKEPLIVIDPTDKHRNAAAALSAENFIKFIIAARRFFASFSDKLFWPAPAIRLSKEHLQKLRNRETKFLALVFQRPAVIDDTLWPQARRSVRRIAGMLNDEEFVVKRSYAWADELIVVLLFELSVWSLPKIKRMVGPSIYAWKNSNDFTEKYKDAPFGPIVEKEEWVVEKNREWNNCTMMLKNLIKKNVKELEECGIPSTIATNIGKAKILEGNEFWNYVQKNISLSDFLRKKYFEVMRL